MKWGRYSPIFLEETIAIVKSDRVTRVPRHVAIIMDGNGRWAARRGWPRTRGHAEGLKRVEEVSEVAGEMGVEILTLYTFSTENWRRPRQEVSWLMDLLCRSLRDRLERFHRRGVRIGWVGEREGLDRRVREALEEAEAVTRKNTGLRVNLAFNYGARREILSAVRHLMEAARAGRLDPSDVDEIIFSRSLHTAGMPDPDLLIRTSGERRLSNFLLWQLSYAELHFTEVLWPDFTADQFRRAVEDFQGRERRFGRVPGGTG